MAAGRILVDGRDRGSGFALATGLGEPSRIVLTAAHVVRTQKEAPEIRFITEAGQTASVERVERDDGLDVAVLHLDEEVPEGLARGQAEEGVTWQVEARPRGNDPKLTGVISDTRRPFENERGRKTHVVQLLVDQQVDEYEGYSGGAVVLQSPPRAVIGVLVEQLRSRLRRQLIDEKMPASNVLYAIPIEDVLAQFELTMASAPRMESRPQHPVPHLAPSRPALDLVGRDDLLRGLKLQLFEDRVLALRGLPGVGKTALAVELAVDDEVKKHFPDGVLWASLGPHADVSGHLAEWAAALEIAPDQIGQARSPWDKAKAVRTVIGDRRLLLVIDDAWQYETALVFKEAGGPYCANLVTTRLPEVALLFAGNKETAVPELDEEDSLTLLEQLAPKVVEEEPEDVKALIRTVDGLPLALTLIGKYLQVRGGTPRRARTALRKIREEKQRLFEVALPQASLERHSNLPPDTLVSLAAVVKTSDEALDEDARHALRALSIFPPKPNTFSEAAAGAVTDAPVETLDTLLDAGLLESVEHGGEEDRYWVHQIVTEYARAELTESAAYERMAEFYDSYVEASALNYLALDLERDNVFAAFQAASEQEMHFILTESGVDSFSTYLMERGLFGLAEDCLNWQLQSSEALVQQTDADTSLRGAFSLFRTLAGLTNLVAQRGDLTQTEALISEVLAVGNELRVHVREMAAEAPDLPGALLEVTSTSTAILGDVATSNGDHERAKELYQSALATAYEANNHELALKHTIQLGSIAVTIADYELAESLYREALSLANETGDYSTMCDVLMATREFEIARGNVSRAEELESQVIHLLQNEYDKNMESAGSVDIPELARACAALMYLASFEAQRGEPQQAREVAQTVLNAIRGIVAAIESVDELKHDVELNRGMNVLRNGVTSLLAFLADLALRRGDYTGAEQFVLQGLSLAYDSENAVTICSRLLNLGHLKVKQGEYEEADKYLRDALELAQDLDHRLLIGTILEEFGQLYLEQQELDAASGTLSEALEVARETGHLRLTAKIVYDLAQVAATRGDNDEARRLGQESVNVFNAIHDGASEKVKQWMSRFYMPDIKQRMGTKLTVPLLEGWHAEEEEYAAEEETITIVSPDRQASVVTSFQHIDPTMDTLRYAPTPTQMLHGDHPGYRELASAEIQFLGERTGFLRRLEWEPKDWEGNKAIAIQVYWAEHGHGVTATTLTDSSNFERFEFQLRGILDELSLEL